jgi:aminoglycoside phosphotransferase (APT) family kinase protein
VREIVTDFFGEEPVSVESAGGEGNHYTYLARYPDRAVFFRGDDGKLDDDYMVAEAVAMELARDRGVPVPDLFGFDTSLQNCPIRYQLFEWIPEECLNSYYRNETLDRTAVSRQLGRYLAALHTVALEGFGFFNTQLLQEERRIVGLSRSNREYFFTKLSDHLKHIRDNGFLQSEEIREVEQLIERFSGLLDVDQGSLVHKDIAFWNLHGTPDRITGITDWDDVVVDDPVDDLSILRCFYEDDVLRPVLEGYSEVSTLPEDFWPRFWLYMLRNMLWKVVIRIDMGYFDIQGDFFIRNQDNQEDFRRFTYERLYTPIQKLRRF